MGDIVQLTSNIEALSTENPVDFLEACESLAHNSESVHFEDILFPRLAFIIPNLIRKTSMSPMQGLQTFFLFKEQDASNKFVSLEENDFDTDFELTHKNSRYHASNLIYILCKKFKKPFLDLFVPSIYNCLLSRDWHHTEAGIFLFHQLDEFIAEHRLPHFVPIIDILLDIITSPHVEYKIPATVTLITYIKYCTHLPYSRFFRPFLEKTLPFFVSWRQGNTKSRVQSYLRIKPIFLWRTTNLCWSIKLFCDKSIRADQCNSNPLDGQTFGHGFIWGYIVYLNLIHKLSSLKKWVCLSSNFPLHFFFM